MSYIVAELSANHNGSLDRALQLIEAAKWAGADSVKLQTYRPEDMVPDDGFVVRDGTWAGHNLFDLYRKAATPWDWHEKLFAHAHMVGIDCFSSPFSVEAVDFLESLDCPRYKIASFEIGNEPLLRAVARTKKQPIVSTGLATPGEIAEAKAWLPSAVLLHCVSAYPAKLEDMNLARILELGPLAGLSDHTLGSEAAVIATVLGAQVIEKHLTLKRSEGGPDATFSSEPEEFKAMVEAVRQTETALGDGTFKIAAAEKPNLQFKRRGQYRSAA